MSQVLIPLYSIHDCKNKHIYDRIHSTNIRKNKNIETAIPGLLPSPAVSVMSTNTAPIITPLVESDFDEWSRVFKESLAHHGDTLPEEQYQKTFTRLVDPKCDAFAIVIRDPVKEDAFLGFAHYFLIPSLKTEKPNMHLSGM